MMTRIILHTEVSLKLSILKAQGRCHNEMM